MKNKKMPLAEIVTLGRVCWSCEHVAFYAGRETPRGGAGYTEVWTA
jgi:hypothetical protein